MAVKNFYQPTPPTDWIPALTNAYDDEMQKLDRFQKAAREADQSRTDAELGIEPITKGLEFAGALARFSSTIAKSQQAKEKQKDKEFETAWEQIAQVDQDKIKQIINDENFLAKDSANVIERLRKAGLNPETLSLLERNSAGNSLKLRRLLASKTLGDSIQDLDYRLEKDPDGDLQKKYDTASLSGNVEGFYKNDIITKLKKLGFDNSYIAAHFKDEIDRLSATKGALASLEYSKVQLTAKGENDVKLLQSISQENIETRANKATEVLQTLLKSNDNNKGKVAAFLHRVLKDGDTYSDVIDLMMDGDTVDFPAGDKGEQLFDQKTWDYIKSGATEHTNTVLATNLARYEGEAASGLAKLNSKDSPFKTQEDWDNFIQPLLGHVSPKTKTKLESQNLAAQGQVQYNRYITQYATSERNGTLDEQIEAIKTIPNFQAREELLVKAQRIKAWKEDPQNKIAYDEGIHEGAVFKARTTNNFNKAESTLSGGDTLIIQDITAFRRQDLAKRILAQYQPDGTFVANPNIAQENLEAVELYKKVNDFGVKGGSGKFALTGNVEEPTWGNYGKTGVDVKYNHNAPLSANADKNFNVRVKETPNKAERHKKVGGIFSTNQLLSWLETGTLSQDMMYIQKREGDPMSNLLEKGLRALVGSKDHKDIVARYNIKEFSKTMPTPDRIILQKLFNRVKASEGNQKQLAANLVSLFKWYGPEVLLHSPKITQQFFNAVNTLNVPDPITLKAAQDENQRLKDEELKRKAEEFANSPAGIAVKELGNK